MRRVPSLIGLLLTASVLGTSAQAPATPGTRRIPPAAAKAGATAGAPRSPQLLPGTRLTVLATIQGDALNSANGSSRNGTSYARAAAVTTQTLTSGSLVRSATKGGLPDAVIRLRDARSGQIVDATRSDKSGAWAFHQIDPGSYVVELMGADQTVLDATEIIAVEAGDAVWTIVRLPFRMAPFGGLLGQTAPSAFATMSAAAASGVLATTATGEPVSPPQ
jgi:hypothetical protein